MITSLKVITWMAFPTLALLQPWSSSCLSQEPSEGDPPHLCLPPGWLLSLSTGRFTILHTKV